MTDMNWVALVTLLILFVYMFFAGMVGFARYKFDVKAPAVSGHPDFERYLRVQHNTLEQLVIVLPVMWLFAFWVSAVWASILGALWLVMRIVYAVVYYRNLANRSLTFGVGMLLSTILFVGSLIAVIMNLLKA